ncbi:DUF4390 domain-containing protein [Aquisalimonas sp.]|uniref:DUF4390 domain-containing protein n=1 Tax=Aquisalimonas sp. TaxID=1872621 RepID=UPI0025C1066C|nr:DUF4390 domain-containing protein [Aquisalimonas sp.]
MNTRTPEASAFAGRLLLIAMMALAGFAPSLAAAERPGFVLAESDIRNDDSGVYLSARFQVRLSDEAEVALESGVPLGLDLQVRVIRPRWWWWDAELADLRMQRELRFHALSRRYVVLNNDTGERRTFFRRDAAIDAWASTVGERVIGGGQLESGEQYELELRARLNPDVLPHPLRTVALVSPEWRLASEWYTWPLDG